jgi:hypothetical protein
MEDIPVVKSVAEIDALPPDTTVLKGVELEDADVAHLAQLPGLANVFLDGCMALSDLALATLGVLPDLEVLYISGNGITDSGLAHLAGSPKLRELGLDAPITGEGFRVLAPLATLTELHLPGCAEMTTDGVAALAALPELRRLCFYNCRTMDDAWLDALAGVRTLFHLTLFRCPGVTDEGVERLRSALPDCDVNRSNGGESGAT